jgi:hypothetical protein
MKEEQVMELDQHDIAEIKKMIYEGRADVCWFLNRKQVKGMIAIIEEHFKDKL